MAFHKLTLNFNGGEMSPFLNSRTDVQKYESGCSKLDNFIILPYGGVVRRPGTQYLGKAKFSNKPCRLIGFNFSTTTNFILEFGDLYIRFWSNGQQVAVSGTPVEVATPYPYTVLKELQYCQINDLMYIVHPSYPPAKVTRNSDTSWTYTGINWKWPPLQDENVNNWLINTSGTSGNITMHCTAGIWVATDVGSTWQIGHNMQGASSSFVEVPLAASSVNSAGLRVRGAWSFVTYGTWSGTIYIVRTIYRTGVVETIRTYYAGTSGQRNISSTGTEDEDCQLQIQFVTLGNAGSSGPTARLEVSNARVYGLVQITGYSGPQDVSGAVAWGLARTDATPYWSRPAFSATYGYPRTVCLHDQRLMLGGTRQKPLSIHGSQIDDYENFQRGTPADNAFMFNIAANESNPINWMVTQTKLLIGTAGNEWAMGAAKTEEAISATNVQVKQQSSYGSAYMQARIVNEVVLFAQRQSKKIRELTYSFEKDGWVAPDLTILASHINKGGFNEMAFSQQPDAILWATTNDGWLVGMTYERDQNVVGWHKHSTQGTFESVGTIYGGSDPDEVWFCVRRNVNGADVRYIERFDPAFRKTLELEDKPNYWYLDCAFRSSNASEVTTVTGLQHLQGLTCGILGDGANQPQRVVSVTGTVSIQEPAKLVLVGLPFSSIVRPMNINVPAQDTMQGRKIRIHKAVVRLYKSLTAKFSADDEKTWNEIFFRERVDLMDSSPAVFTGDKEFSAGAKFAAQQALTVMQDRPFPLCVLAEILWVDYYGE